MPAKTGTRTYRDLKGRTTRKYRNRRYDRIPGDQFDPEKALEEFEVPSEEEIVDVPAEELEYGPAPGGEDEGDVTSLGLREESEEEMAYEETPEEAEEEAEAAAEEEDFPEEVDEEEEDEGAAEAGMPRDKESCGPGPKAADTETKEAAKEENVMDIKDVSIEEVEVIEDEPRQAETTAEPEKKATTEGFAERLRKAMDGPEEEIAVELGEEAPPAAEEAPECPPCAGEEVLEVEEEIPEISEEEVEVVEKATTVTPEVELMGGEKEASAEEDADSEVTTAEPAEETPAEEAAETDAPIYETLGTIETPESVTAERVALVLTNEDTENPHYVVLVDGEPLAKVALGDQPENLARDHSELFLDDDYPRFVLEGVQQFGLKETLRNINARYYQAEALKGQVAAEMKKAAGEELEQEHRERLTEMKERLMNTASIVLQGSLKNYIVENPLRDELVRLIRSAGVDENSAIDIVEEAFTGAGFNFFSNVLAKAEEWLGAPEGVLDHHVNEITAMSYRHPGYNREDDDIAPPAPQSVAEVPSSVPVRTVASPMVKSAEAAPQSGDWRAQKDRWKQSLNLHGRTARASLSNFRKPQ